MIDYRLAQHASRRAGVKFKVLLPRRRYTTNRHKLTWDDVKLIRRYAAREGYGLPVTRQVDALLALVPARRGTIVDVLANHSWFDPTYVPGAPDREFWHGVAPAVLLVRLIGRRG